MTSYVNIKMKSDTYTNMKLETHEYHMEYRHILDMKQTENTICHGTIMCTNSWFEALPLAILISFSSASSLLLVRFVLRGCFSIQYYCILFWYTWPVMYDQDYILEVEVVLTGAKWERDEACYSVLWNSLRRNPFGVVISCLSCTIQLCL